MDDRERTEARINKLLARRDKREALSWLRGGNEKSYRFLAEWTTEESLELIEQLYQAGAKEVWAVRFDRNPPYESINTLIVTLPDDPEARERVFAWSNEQAEGQGFDSDEDYGQQHLFVWFD